MTNLNTQKALVIGLGVSGRAAVELLVHRGVPVVAVDSADTGPLRRLAGDLRASGIRVELGADSVSGIDFDLAVLSPGVPLNLPLVEGIRARGIRIISELELGYAASVCLNVAVTGTNGKTTTTRLIERMLLHSGKRTVAAGSIGTPVCAVAAQTRDLDVLTLEVSSFQLESVDCFRPIIAVLTNLAPDHIDRHGTMDAYLRVKARLFQNQFPFDWAILQLEALKQFEAARVRIAAKRITFSAVDPEADLHMDRSLLISRIPGWEGPLLDMSDCKLRGPGNAENCMAALAVGRTLRLRLEDTVEAIRSFDPLPHRCEWLEEVRGVQYINDSKSTSLHSLTAALRSTPSAPGGRPNVWLIAGGKDKGLEYHDAGALLSERVKGAFLIGETRDRLRSAWGLFTPCRLCDSLLEAVREAARQSVPGDVVLLSPACSSFDQFQDYQHRGDTFKAAVADLRAVASA